MTKPIAFFTALQALRGYAVLAVCLAHLQGSEGKLPGAPILGTWAHIGFAGVDLFFVISGFVMVWVTRNIQGNAASIPPFFVGRFLRIYPLWWLVLSAMVVVWMVRPEWVYARHHAQPNIVLSYLLLPAQGLPLHAVGWTLKHEVWFYFIFGLMLSAPKKALPFLLLGWGTIVAAAAIVLPAPNNPWIALVRHPLTLEFILGAFVGLLATKKYFPLSQVLLRLGLFWLLLSCASIISNPTPTFETEWLRVFLFGCPFALILWGWVGSESQGANAPAWACSVGDWSYGLYLIHVPVFVAIARLFAPVSGPGPIDNLAILTLSFATAIGIAYVLHITIERPIARLSKQIINFRHSAVREK